MIESPQGIAVDPQGAIYVATLSRVKKIGTDGIISRIAGDDVGHGTPPAGASEVATQMVMTPAGVAVGADGSVFITDDAKVLGGYQRIYKVYPSGRASLIAGGGDKQQDGIVASDAVISAESIALLPDGDLVFADRRVNRVRRVGLALPGLAESDILIQSKDGARCMYSIALAGTCAPWRR